MIILGLHFGHDAGVAVVKDGRVLSHVLRERYTRVKHAISLEMSTIETALSAAGITVADLDCVAITSTQVVELIIDDGRRFSISMRSHPSDSAPSTLREIYRRQGIDPATRCHGAMLTTLDDPAAADSTRREMYRLFYPEHATRKAAQTTSFGWMDGYFMHPSWRGVGLPELASAGFAPLFSDDVARLGFHFPVTVTLDGRELPGYFVSHHSAHAASAFYASDFDQAAIFTHDGFAEGDTYLSGMYFWGNGRRIYPITPNYLAIGALYEYAGTFLGLGHVGPAGKLMGLAAYGKPQFFDQSFAGNWIDWQRKHFGSIEWVRHCLKSAADAGYDMAPDQRQFSDQAAITSPLGVDIAASTQRLFEEISLTAVRSMFACFSQSGHATRNLCMSGGPALNCPANGRIFREGPYPRIFIEPGCDDSGLALGAAKFIAHNIFDEPRPGHHTGAKAAEVSTPCELPYLGIVVGADRIKSALAAVAEKVVVQTPADAARAAAEDLAADRVIAWYEGRSEIGPRALGHRSILADARPATNWPRLNRLKGREAWRPFAPAVLAAEAHRWFQGTPDPSPYMLFTGTVKSGGLPAITHVDNTTRLQTVDESCGEFYRVLMMFFELTGMPVILNTSFNGPGEPIIESPDEALRFLLETSLDALFIGGHRVTRVK